MYLDGAGLCIRAPWNPGRAAVSYSCDLALIPGPVKAGYTARRCSVSRHRESESPAVRELDLLARDELEQHRVAVEVRFAGALERRHDLRRLLHALRPPAHGP